MDTILSGLCGFGLHFTLDGFRLLHGFLASFMWLTAMVFSREAIVNDKRRFYLFSLFTYLSTMGVFFSADLYTTFLFFEIMSFTSYVWVVHDRKKESLKAAETYLAIAVMGGLVMLMGLFLLYNQIGTLQISEIATKMNTAPNRAMLYVSGFCMLFGFGAKAGIFGLHIWMADTYTCAPAPASALLSGILSKTGLYGIIIITGNLFLGDRTWGCILLVFGLFTMAVGAVLAVSSIQLKRILAYSSMSQIGFMLVGIGMVGILGTEGTLAARGTVLHMMNHSLIKLILFIGAGIIFKNTGMLGLNEIQGYGRKKPFLNALFLISALGIGGIPFFNGYVSKTLIHESIVEAIAMKVIPGNFLSVAEWIFLISGGFTVAYMSKIYIALFIQKNKNEKLQMEYDKKKSYVGLPTMILLSIAAAVLPLMGLLPNIIADGLADMSQGILRVEELTHQIAYFSFGNLKGAIISITIGIVVYFLFVGYGKEQYAEKWPEWFQAEKKVYRPLFLKLLPGIMGFFSRFCDSIVDLTVVFLRKTIFKDEKLPHELEEGTKVTYSLGSILNMIMSGLNSTFRRKNPIQTDYIHWCAVKNDELAENQLIIQRSLSFGLLLFCVGLCITLLYMLF